MSSKRAIRRRSCEGKKRYESQEATRKHVRWLHRNGSDALPYKCRFCGQWHVGRPSMKIRKQIQERGWQ